MSLKKHQFLETHQTIHNHHESCYPFPYCGCGLHSSLSSGACPTLCYRRCQPMLSPTLSSLR
eukprot:08090.XXX_208783_209028_1 [CDS] Oithona nana genome sequencing.